MLLQVNNLKVSFKDLEVVRGVDINIDNGQIVGILGESGSGKTVSSNAIIRLIDEKEGKITSGEVLFNNDNILKLPENKIRKIRGKEISYIFQNPTESLNPYRKIGSQIKEILKIHNLKYSKELIINALKDVGLENAEIIYNKYPFQVSGGECQRITIAMGIITNPKLLIADEPTSSIDASIRKKVLNLLKKINEKYNTSIMIITHDFDVAKYLCDKIYIMYGGLVMEYGNVDEILNSPLHPYTKSLLNCVNSLDDIDDKLYVIDGHPISPTEFSDMCPFYERCSEKVKECKNELPKLKSVNDRYVRCIRGQHE